MSLIEYTPATIVGIENMTTKETVTAEHWNRLFNLLIAQGNNSTTAIYNMLNAIAATTAAAQVGAATITGVTGTTVQTIMSGLKGLLDLCYTAAATDTLLAQKETVANANQLVKNIAFNSVNGVFTITTQGGTVTTIDTALEKVAVNFTYDQATQSLILTLADGSTTNISLSAFIQENDFLDSSTIDFSVTDHIVTATIKNGSITETMLAGATLTALIGYKNSAETAAINAAASEANALTYRNTAGVSASEALASKNAAKVSETNSKTSETNSKTSETNSKASETNAATSASQALQYRNEAEAIVGQKVTSFNGRTGVVLPADADYLDTQIALSAETRTNFGLPETARLPAVTEALYNAIDFVGGNFTQHESDTFVHTTDLEKQAWDSAVVLKGVTAPTTATVGAVGQFYLDTVMKALYQCKAVDVGVYTWENVVADPVGTIVSTLAPSLGSDFALCNGAYFNKTDYPQLYETALTKVAYGVSSITIDRTVYTDAVSKIPKNFCYSDTQIAVITQNGILWCNRDNLLSWNFISFTTIGFTATSFNHPTIAFVNGKWVITAWTPPTGSQWFLAVGSCASLTGSWTVSNSAINTTYICTILKSSGAFLVNGEVHILVCGRHSSGYAYGRVYDVKASDSTLLNWTVTQLTIPEQSNSSFFPQEISYQAPLIDGSYAYVSMVLINSSGSYRINVVQINMSTGVVTNIAVMDSPAGPWFYSNVVKNGNNFYYFRCGMAGDVETSNTVYLYTFTAANLVPVLTATLVLGAVTVANWGTMFDSRAKLSLNPGGAGLIIGGTSIAKLWVSGTTVTDYIQRVNDCTIITPTEIINYPSAASTAFVLSQCSADICQVPSISSPGYYTHIKVQ